MSYDPPQFPRHRAGNPQQPAAGYNEPPWARESYPPQPGYPDAFGGTAPDYGGYGGYPDPRYPDPRYGGYPDPATGYRPPDPRGATRAQPTATSAGSAGSVLSAPDAPSWSGSGYGQWLVRPGRGVVVGAVMGLMSAAVAIGVATLAAAFFRPQASPIIAVGEAFIDRTPPALKNFALEKFGEDDKTVLLLGMYITIALLAMTIGVLARRHVTIGVVGVTVFGLFGAFIAYNRPASETTDVIPSIIGGIAGIIALLWLAKAGEPELNGSKLTGSRMSGSGLTGSRLDGAGLTGSRLDRAGLDSAGLDSAVLDNARLAGPTEPYGYQWPGGRS
jgi:hypothetical protein